MLKNIFNIIFKNTIKKFVAFYNIIIMRIKPIKVINIIKFLLKIKKTFNYNQKKNPL